jgi:hypothetical protein
METKIKRDGKEYLVTTEEITDPQEIARIKGIKPDYMDLENGIKAWVVDYPLGEDNGKQS